MCGLRTLYPLLKLEKKEKEIEKIRAIHNEKRKGEKRKCHLYNNKRTLDRAVV